eukprot:m.1430057 g.1430057  ORF g.1430057 m.1430057 type:complete len:1055 (+) comp25071_c0_seq3:71-3235(+)
MKHLLTIVGAVLLHSVWASERESVKGDVPLSCDMRPSTLRVNALERPLGVPSGEPVFSWGFTAIGAAPRKNQRQSAYQIRCTSADELLWDSKKVMSSQSLQIPYDGVVLQSMQGVQWEVTVWDDQGTQCDTVTSSFEVALLDEKAWDGAQWLSRYNDPLPADFDRCTLYNSSLARNQAPRFRTEVVLPSDIVDVRAYVVGLGYYEMFVDGKRVGTSRLDPGWTSYDKTVLYAVHNLTDILHAATISPARLKHSTPGMRDLEASTHAIGIALGNGWWNPTPMLFWGRKDIRNGLVHQQGRDQGEPMFRALIVGTRSDGTKVTIAKSTAPSSDSRDTASPTEEHGTRAATASWMAAGSPTTFNSIYLGEKYDARLEQGYEGWTSVGYSTANWTRAVPANTTGLGTLEAQSTPPIRVQETLPTSVVSQRTATGGGVVTLLDTSKNHAGVCSFILRGGATGDVVALRYGELLADDGTLNPMTSVAGQIKGPNSALPCQPAVAYQADEVILNGSTVTWTPQFSWHGFRYLEVTHPANVVVDAHAVTCVTMRTDFDVVANFTSSDPFLADLRTLARNTFESNAMSVQSDCPHRERFGYGGDPLGCGEAGLSIYDWSTFYRKRVRDFNDAQRVNSPTGGGNTGNLTGFTETSPFVGIADAGLGPGTGPIGWETFQVEAQWWLYKYYGDTRTLHESYAHTQAYIDLLDSAPAGIAHGLGDWMPVQGTSPAFTGPGFLRMSYLGFANISSVLGKPAAVVDAYRKKADDVAGTINTQFLNPSTGSYGASGTTASAKATQTGQGMALFMDIVPPGVRDEALNVLTANIRAAENITGACRGGSFGAACTNARGGVGPHLTAGLFGIKWVLMALADGGFNDLAYEMLANPSYPGLRWMMNNPFANATTIWEAFYFSDNTFSHNHPMFASSEVWLIQSVAGIQPHPAANGFDHVLIKPGPPRQLNHASGTYATHRGIVAVSWARETDGAGGARTFALNVTIPPNMVATVHVPHMAGAVVFEHGPGDTGPDAWQRLERRRFHTVSARSGVYDADVLTVGSGVHRFKTML